MKTSDWAIVGLNVFTLLMAVVGLAVQEAEPMSMALVLALTTALVNAGWVLRRAPQQREAAPAPLPQRATELEEMDARTLLDIDARLEALERREREMDEADRIRQMAARGEQSAPAPAEPAHLGPEADRVRT